MKTSQFLRAAFPITLALLLMMVFLTPTAHADTATFEIVSAGSSGNLGGVDTSPYNAIIGGGSGPIIPAVCDDFTDEVVPPESWTANVTQVSSLAPTGTSSPPMYYAGASSGSFNVTVGSTVTPFSGWTLDQARAYAVASDLAIQILQATTGSQAQQDLSFAVWELFNPVAVMSNKYGTLPSQDLLNASNDIVSAIAANPNDASALQYSNVEIYTYAGGGVTCSGSCAPPPQEFIVVTPEPASMLLFGTGLLGIAFIMRKRFQKDALL